MRWRVEKELIIGKGQFKCGNKDCTDEESLRTWEVNFVYLESNEKKSALVKLSKFLQIYVILQPF